MLQEFSYHAPKSKKELFKLLAQYEDNRILAGGTDIMVEFHNNFRTTANVIDIKRIKELNQISFDKKEGLSIGATATCYEVMNNKFIAKRYPVIADAASRIGSIQLRHRATICGNLCTASPSGDMACALLVLDAKMEIISDKKTRIIPLNKFFTGPKKTCLKKGEIVSRIIVPIESADSKALMEKLKRIKGHDIALVSAAVSEKDNVIKVAVGACGPTPVLLKSYTKKTRIDAILKDVEKKTSPIDDVRASADYRVFMAKTYVEKMLKELM